MHVLFVDNFFFHPNEATQSVGISPHLGLLSLSATLMAAGHRAEIFDPKLEFATARLASADEHFVERCALRILRSEPDVLGFTAYGLSFPFVVHVARRLKALRPSLPIALGGPHPTIVGSAILSEFSCFDVVVRFEAENTICAVVEALGGSQRLLAIPNLVVRAAGSPFLTRRDESLVDLDELPHLPFSMYPIRELAIRELPIESGRGCPFPCTFCSTSNFFQRKYRLKSARRLLAEMDRLHAEWDTCEFSLNHDLFGLKKSAVLEFCELVRGRGYTWSCSMRPDLLPLTQMEQMVGAGCRRIFFGVESGSPSVQQAIGKRLDLMATRETLRHADALGLQAIASFVLGFPDEAPSDQQATLDLASELLLSSRRICVQTHMLSPEPGSRLLAERAGDLQFDGLGPELGGLVDAQMIAAAPEVFSVYYHFKGQIPHWQTLIARSALECYEELLGRPLLEHVLSFACDGRLSVLVNRVSSGSPPASTAPEALKSFMREALLSRGLGASCPNYLKDAVRLMTTFAALRPIATLRPISTRPTAGWHSARRVKLASGARLERFETDAASVLERILRAPQAPVAEHDAGMPSAYLLFAAGADYHVRALPRDWEPLLSRLTLGTGYASSAPGVTRLEHEVIEKLGGEGLLEIC